MFIIDYQDFQRIVISTIFHVFCGIFEKKIEIARIISKKNGNLQEILHVTEIEGIL